MNRSTGCQLFSNPRRSAFIGSLLLLILAIPSGVGFAQGGGKAEPNRIEFKRGSHTTTMSGTVRGDEEAEYVFSAKQGQRLTIKLTSVPARSSCFDLKGPEGIDVGLEFDCNWTYAKTLSATGDYFMSVKRPTTARGRSSYKLTLTIR